MKKVYDITLASYSPLVAAARVAFYGPTTILTLGPKNCTVGAVATRNGVPGFITAAHCSEHEGNAQGDKYWQPLITSTNADEWIGTELIDPGSWSCGFRTCWVADASFVAIGNGASIMKGYMARAQGAVGPSGGIGGKENEPLNPLFLVDGYTSTLVQNQRVYKFGAYTGFTYGTILQTCTDFASGLEVVVCAATSTNTVHEGDSGGPVFLWDGVSDVVVLAGITLGEDGGKAYFSPMARVVQHLGGSFDFDAPRLAAPQPSGSVTLEGYPALAWAPVQGATTYRLERVYQNNVTGEHTITVLGNVTSPYENSDWFVTRYVGTQPPPDNSPGYISYRLTAQGPGMLPNGTTVFFEIMDEGP